MAAAFAGAIRNAKQLRAGNGGSGFLKRKATILYELPNWFNPMERQARFSVAKLSALVAHRICRYGSIEIGTEVSPGIGSHRSFTTRVAWFGLTSLAQSAVLGSSDEFMEHDNHDFDRVSTVRADCVGADDRLDKRVGHFGEAGGQWGGQSA